MQTLNTRNYLQWMQDLENTLRNKTLPQHLINLAIVQETIVQQIQEAAEWEVEKAITCRPPACHMRDVVNEVDLSSAHQTIFRGNTVFTKTMEKCIAWYGSSFLEASIGTVLRRLIAEKIAIEVDPVRSGKNAKDVGRHVDLLIYWCKEFWDQIYLVKEDCPKYVSKRRVGHPWFNGLQRITCLVRQDSYPGRGTWPQGQFACTNATTKTVAKCFSIYLFALHRSWYSSSTPVRTLFRYVGV